MFFMVKPASKGFTLIEVLIGVILLGIMATMAVPLSNLVESFKLDYLNQRIYASTTLARSEAIKRGELVSLCQSNSGTTCDGGANWAAGWMMFTNPNNDDVVDSGEAVIRIVSPMTTPVRITWSNGSRLTFIPRGSPVSAGMFDMCPVGRKAAPLKMVSVSVTGQIRKSSGTGDCDDPENPQP